jgi:hypothetical protein
MEATSPCRIHARVGNSVFKAEGPQDVVKEGFDLFLGVLTSIPGAVPKTNGKHPANGKPNAAKEEGLSEDFHEQFEPVTKELLDRAFRIDGKSLSLSVLPQTNDRNADAILLLVYGYAVLRDQKEIGAYSLAASARQSGVMISRVDRTLSKMPTYIMRGGSGQATRYSITNPGRAKAEKLLAEMYS